MIKNHKSKKGISLVSVIVSVMVILILTSISIKISMDNYERIQYEKLQNVLKQVAKEVEIDLTKAGIPNGAQGLDKSSVFTKLNKVNKEYFASESEYNRFKQKEIDEYRKAEQYLGEQKTKYDPLLIRVTDVIDIKKIYPNVIKYKGIWIDLKSLEPVVIKGVTYKGQVINTIKSV